MALELLYSAPRMRIFMNKSFIQTMFTVSVVSFLGLVQTSLADDKPASSPSPVSGTVISCGLDAYNNKIATIKKFNTAENFASFGVGTAGAGWLAILAEGGGATGPVVLVGVGAIGAAVGTYYAIKGVKSFESRHFKEVSDNLTEALALTNGHDGAGDKALRHTVDLVNRKSGSNYSEPQVLKALLEAAQAGDFCDANGQLLVTGSFRKIILAHLEGIPVHPSQVNPIASSPAQSGQNQSGIADAKDSQAETQSQAQASTAPSRAQSQATTSGNL
jgi:hypothetical protein